MRLALAQRRVNIKGREDGLGEAGTAKLPRISQIDKEFKKSVAFIFSGWKRVTRLGRPRGYNGMTDARRVQGRRLRH